MRASDHDRDLTVERLQVAFTEGRLTPVEMDQRLERALAARTHDELEGLLADLPAPAKLVHLESKNGSLQRAGDWEVPRTLRVVSKYGSADLDMSEARCLHPIVEVRFELAYGSAKIVLPVGASADADELRTGWGSVSLEVSQHSGMPHVRVTGELSYGNLVVRYPRKRWFTQS
ncbi:DUF1707 SHOCT-like domain-containing protein [Nonomuraea soli]|uniref:DUF1707 domain-containing protein n=1 Tax=Nonomuraea soli TaxID=1032476 RepID=A0A7W0CLV1_9ACTN|nr:DUF1707 domain-containing protein [Nonomuraea soli]MBA2893586.1 hypothetical protein [Nonomuraea soli]